MILNGRQILKASVPEAIFSSPEEVKAEYKVMAKHWYPDTNKDPIATQVMGKLNDLYHEALKRIDSGSWIIPGTLTLHGTDGKTRKIKYKVSHSFELGEVYYGAKVIVYTIKIDFADLFNNARKILGSLKYRDSDMEKEFSRFFPKILSTFETKEYCVMVIEKTPDVFMLHDVLQAVGGHLEPRHVAWMQNRIQNINCYLQWAGLTHNDISPKSVFVSPEHHTILLLGGWWFAKKVTSKLDVLTERAYKYSPSDIVRTKIADHRLDLTMSRVLGRELLGDISGLSYPQDVPDPFAKYLKFPTGGRATDDYRSCETALKASYGARRFVKLVIDPNDIYQH